jgi:hypothetical protein
MGGSSVLFDGMKLKSSRICAMLARSSGAVRCATPLFEACAEAPPSVSLLTSSCVTVLMTSGPVMNM